MTTKIFKKLTLAVFCVLILALTVVDLLASRVARNNYEATMTRELGLRARTLATGLGARLAAMPSAELRGVAKSAKARITLVGRDGRVLADSEADPAIMDNHATRPEIVAALRGEQGSDARQSHTIGMQYLYVAIPVPEGALRVAVPLSDVDEQVASIRRQMLAATALAFLPAVVIAAVFARYLSARLGVVIDYAGELAQGNFEARLGGASRDELGILSAKLNETGEKLQKMFEELQREHAELEKVERIRKDFVINVSHELRTPLASIQGYTETLLDGALEDAEHNVRFLTIIRQNAERLGRLTADLMTLSRIELKTQKFQSASYYVNTLLLECVDSMTPMAQKKNVAILQELADDEVEVFCDAEAVHQVLSNLMDNALKYTPEGGRITIGARWEAHLRGRDEVVHIWVRDTGVGIPAEDLPRLFERFYRVDKARSRELGGTGLGLAIVKHLVRAQGGEAWVESTVGEGSTFSFSLPVHDLGLLEFEEVQAEVMVS